jgi:hypothetical protein
MCAFEHIGESGPVNVECDLVWVGRRAGVLGLKEDEQRLAESEWAVLALPFLGARQLEIGTPQTIRVRRSKRQVVDAQNPHAGAV